MADEAPLTDLIRQARDGDDHAVRLIFDRTYPELRALARTRLSRSGRAQMLDTTSLVHESFLRFADAGRLTIEDRHHFLRYAGAVMRSVVVDFVRERLAERRGGDVLHVTLDPDLGAGASAGEREILRVHDALEELGQRDPRLVEVVQMRYFAGMTETEIASALGITDRTVRRDWEKARLLLAKTLSQN